jgi:hypothetical protein
MPPDIHKPVFSNSMSLPTSLFFAPMTLSTRVFGKIPASFYGKTPVSGMDGCLQIYFSDLDSYWHLEFKGSSFSVRAKPCDQARASLELDEKVFFKLLTSKLEFSTALMLGTIHGKGDAEMYFAFASLVERYRYLCRQSGFPGWLFRKTQNMITRRL